MNGLTKEGKLEKIINFVNSKKITSYSLAKNTGLNESGINRLIKGEINNPHKTTIDTLYNYLFINDVLEKEPFLKKDKASFSVEEVSLFVINNQSSFMKIKAFSNMIGLLARDKIIEIMKEREIK